MRAGHDIFTNRDENIPERSFYLPDDDVSGRHRKGDVIVTSDETIMVGVVKGVEPGVLVVPDGVREIATGAGAGVTAGGLLLPESLETIRQFAFPDAGELARSHSCWREPHRIWRVLWRDGFSQGVEPVLL